MSDSIVPATPAVSRRAALKALGAGAGAVAIWPWLSDEGLLAFTDVQTRNAPPSPKVVPAARFATLQALVEAIIPADERSPGAKEARVADYIDLRAERHRGRRSSQQFLDGLAALDAEAAARTGADVRADRRRAQVDALLTDLSRNERPARRRAADARLEQFFVGGQAGHHPRLLHVGDRHPQGAALQGQPELLAEFQGCQTVDGQGLPALRAEGPARVRGDRGASRPEVIHGG